jgi:hypothetical protein
MTSVKGFTFYVLDSTPARVKLPDDDYQIFWSSEKYFNYLRSKGCLIDEEVEKPVGERAGQSVQQVHKK